MTSKSKSPAQEAELFKMIPTDSGIFDNLSISSGGRESTISGPFSEYEKSEVYNEKRKSTDMQNMDIYKYFSFSEEFQSAMKSVKESSAPSDQEVFVENGSPKKESRIQLDLEKKAEGLFREIMTEYWKKSSDEEDDKKSGSSLDVPKENRKGKSKDEKKKVVEDEEEADNFDTMSGYWRMLSAYEDFRISPPDYNAYENESPHWLETKIIPFEVFPDAR
ncbi:UNVERIFIED_CONTAM: hypothetical protein PYX00_005266 [Menopon gallinae]|uniref:Uncharacterized protein n=1 Tax=Menopon gallinae TaxID=328185 RepID=A0AAW2HQK6_9NEOP